MKKNLMVVFVLMVLTSCGNTKKGTGSASSSDSTSVPVKPFIENIPSCLRQTLDKIWSKQYDSPPLQIDEYVYKGKKVYLHTADCCDQYNIVFDETAKAFAHHPAVSMGEGIGSVRTLKIRRGW